MNQSRKGPSKDFRTTRPGIDLLCVVLLTLTGVFLRTEALTSFGTFYLGGWQRDAGLYVWLVRTFGQAPLEALAMETPAFYPYGYSRAWSDNFLIPSAVWWMLTSVGVSEIAAYNSVMLLAGVLNGVTLYFLACKTGADRASSLAGALAFQFLPYLTANLGHPQIQFAFFVPWSITCALTASERPSFKSFFFLTGIVGAAFLTAVYVAVFAALASAAVIITAAILGVFRPNLRDLGLSVVGASIGSLPLLFFVRPYFAVRETFEARALYEAYYFAASALSYISHSPVHALFGATSTFSHAEGQLGGGYLLLLGALIGSVHLILNVGRATPVWFLAMFGSFAAALLFTVDLMPGPSDRYIAAIAGWIVFGAWFFYLGRQRSKTTPLFFRQLCLVSLGLLFLLLSFGPLGNPAKREWAFSVYTFFHAFFPGVDGLRAVARYGIVVWAVGAALLAIGMSALCTSTFRRLFALCVVAAIVLLESRHSDIPLEPPRPAPPIVATLGETLMREDAVLFLPFAGDVQNSKVVSWGEFAELSTSYMNWMVGLEGKLVNGYSGQRSKLILELPLELADFPSPRSLARLSTIVGLERIVVIRKLLGDERAQFLDRELPKYQRSLRVEARDNEGNLLLRLQPEVKLASSGQGVSLLLPSGTGMTLHSQIGAGAACDPSFKGKVQVMEEPNGLLIRVPRTPKTVRPWLLQAEAACPVSLLNTKPFYSIEQGPMAD